MDLFAPLDGYCERLMAGFWAEPVNAITNAAFLVAAYFVWRLSISRDDRVGGLLALNIAAIGIGSFLFHTFANRLTAILDVLPILIFMLSFLGVFLRRVFGLKMAYILIAFVLFIATFPAIGALAPLLGLPSGMVLYLPAILVMAVLVVAAKLVGAQTAAMSLALTLGLFVISLSLRTIDLPLCRPGEGIQGIGTHFAWHLLNAWVLARLGTLLIELKREPRAD